MNPPRWVLDTNVLLSALLFPAGRLAWVREAWRAGRITPLVSRETTTELIRVLCYPRFALADDEREDLMADHLAYVETVVVSPVPVVPACRDRYDRPFLELALAGRADALVTGDKDLLVLARDFPTPIIAPRDARARLRESR